MICFNSQYHLPINIEPNTKSILTTSPFLMPKACPQPFILICSMFTVSKSLPSSLLDLALANLNRLQPVAETTIYRKTSDQKGMTVSQNCIGFFQSLIIEKVKRTDHFVKLMPSQKAQKKKRSYLLGSDANHQTRL